MRVQTWLPRWLIGLLLAAVVVACAPAAPLSTPAAAPVPLPTPASPPALSVEPGTTKITARWRAVANADSYQVRWRPQGGDFVPESLLTVADPVATFAVPEQGLWAVNVQACNDAGCGQPATATAPVIINISGHHAVRVWHDDAGIQLDWDALPGYYLVQYRTSTDNTWKSSPPLAKVGYTITDDDLASFSRENGIGHLIAQVFFNCNAAGENCALLGRHPNTTMQELPRFGDQAGPLPTPAQPAASGAGDAAPGLIADPLTSLLRPAGDFTVTTEYLDGGDTPYTCTARPAENRWEKARFGEVVKKCLAPPIVETIDLYLLDESAVFPDGSPCGARPAQNAEERRDFGATVKVCNTHVDERGQPITDSR